MHSIAPGCPNCAFLPTAAFTVLFAPTSQVSLESYAATRDLLVLETLEAVKSRYAFWRYGAGGQWSFAGQEAEAVIRGSSISAVDSDESNEYWLTSSSFVSVSRHCARGLAPRGCAH